MTGQSESETEVIEIKDLDNYPKKKKRKSEQQFICSYDDCKAVFKRLYRLKRHLRSHTGERPFVCNIKGCFRSFTCKSYLHKHQKRPHNIDGNPNDDKPIKPLKQYICNECQKEFKSKFQLRLHTFQHFGQKPFDCHKCDKHFATKTKLKSHLKTHEGYICGREGCDYKTFKWSELRKHSAVVHKNSFKCDVCNKTFSNEYNLNFHKQTIHLNPNEKIVCTYDNCNKSYTRKSNLLTHIRAKHEKQIFKCTEEGCLLSFLHKKSLTLHLENHSKPKTQKTETQNKICRKRVSNASKLTGIDLNESQTIELMNSDLQFRKQILQKEI